MRWPGNPKLSSDRVLGVKRKEQCNPNFSGAHKVSDPRVGLLGPNAVGRYRRAAEKSDESHGVSMDRMHSVPASQGWIAGYRIGEDQSGGNGTILQPVSRPRTLLKNTGQSAELSVGRLARLRSGQSVGVTSMTAAIS
jgi:hypothetical protein